MTPWTDAPWEPRAWQAAALPVIIAGLKRREAGIVSAVMGSGKSILQSELVALALERAGDRAIVLTVPREALVSQLAETLRERIGGASVGVFYGKKKQSAKRVIVACNPSVPALHLELASRQRSVALLIADEAHGTEGEVLRESIPLMRPAALVGFTATPFRSVPHQAISLFSTVFFRYTMEDAIRDRVLVPMQHHRLVGDPPADGDVDEACLQLMGEHAHGPGIVSASTIADADAYAEWLSARGWAAESIHSQHSAEARGVKLARLRTGELRALVHVSLLAEGVDLPWLRWLCLRRPVQARVRFLQEVGRVLRTMDPRKFAADIERFGPKTDGVVLDPHLLLGRHGLVTVEAIGRALQEAADVEAEETVTRGAVDLTERQAVALDVLLAHLAQVRAELEDYGIVQPRQVEAGGWMLADISAKQVEALKAASRLTANVAPEYRDSIKALLHLPYALTRGQASDLLDVLYGGARYARPIAEERGCYSSQVHWESAALSVPPLDPDLVRAATSRRRAVDAAAGKGVG